MKYYLNFYWTTPNYLQVKATDKDPTSKTTIFIIIGVVSVSLIGISMNIGAYIYYRKKKQKKVLRLM